MIRVVLFFDDTHRMVRIRLRGHAGAALYGRDPVCAGVSAVVLGIVHAADELLGCSLVHGKSMPGDLDCRLPKEGSVVPEVQERMEFLLAVMASILRAISADHPQYVSVKTEGSRSLDRGEGRCD
ncbi:ribosomal-processing cysteine protease Prp [Pasteuria penetrans]|uniref:ribosomal-processing cysteine protease Prp n=1 Tax=Pasteuria penetrans TaxID=86005 RepID=UPI000FB8197C|nr:ribosomal-processing cysteine protease Prp [Pasteuria penetrans]